ncbi:acyl-CoA thioesterase-1 [Catalinimonas alkaloidigena]|uniref:SGNH/GDSL hydrolase family protein n=1 Tax=Catalinimonas alkaloidigena TaxID=1075417 RepID=UPI0024071BAF|nr:SGNH/GDSL hydrolase family protein [Catalinimonas alkaloidigena]MDF9799359.1 acyl-CoA thioesterase-1 [Catalinimonas alkaloidigena]
MEKVILSIALLFTLNFVAEAQSAAVADTATYLSDVKKELNKVWPDNRTINLVFHGHSVPAGYWHDHEVHTLESYPNRVLKQLKAQYPYAVINVIVTAIGGENSVQGQMRFEGEVLTHNPDVLMIDYALNDRSVGLEKAREAWEKMIQSAMQQEVKVILLTPSPDQRVDILEIGNPLAQHAEQIRELAEQYHIGLADPFTQFQKLLENGETLETYMSHVNHPNEKGHEVIVQTLLPWFIHAEK